MIKKPNDPSKTFNAGESLSINKYKSVNETKHYFIDNSIHSEDLSNESNLLEHLEAFEEISDFILFNETITSGSTLDVREKQTCDLINHSANNLLKRNTI